MSTPLIRQLETNRSAEQAAAERLLEAANQETRQMTTGERTALDEHLGTLKLIDEHLEDLRHTEERKDAYDRAVAHIPGPENRDLPDNWLPSLQEYAEIRSTTSSGNAFVPAGYSQVWYDRLRPASVVLAAGPRILDTTNTTLSVPKINASVTVGTTAEATIITPSDPTFGSVLLTPHKFAALALCASEALDDSMPDLRQVISTDLIRSMATAIDKQFLAGDGTSNNVKGLRNQSGLTAGPSLGTNGGTPTLDTYAAALEAYETAGADLGCAVWFMHPRTWSTIRKSKDSQSRYQVSPNPTADAPRSLWGLPVQLSTNISITETVGTSTDCSYALLACMDDVIVARRKDVEVLFDQSYAFNSDQVAVRAIARMDLGIANPAAVVLTTGIRG